VLSCCILFSTCFLAYITATFIVEAVSVANTVDVDPGRKESIFHEECYKTPELNKRSNDADAQVKNSSYYIRQKMELGVIFERCAYPWTKIVFISILIIYAYGAMALKYASAAECLYQGVSFILYGSEEKILEYIPGAYYYCVFIFGILCIIFSFGDIENSKNLQIFSVIARFVVIAMMYFGTVFYLAKDGVNHAPVFDWKTQV